MLARLLAGKALAAVAVVGLTATGAAAATDSLPDPVQRVVSDAAGHVGVNIPHPNRGKSAAHRQDGEHRQDGTHGQGGDAGQPTGTDGPTNGMSGVVEELKTDRGPEAGPLGPDVCVVASDGKCHSGDGNPGQGGDVGEGTTPPDSGPPAENPGQGHGPPAHPGGDAGTSPTGDESEDEDTPPTPPSTGGFETGKANSGGRAAGPAGKSQPAGD